MSAGCLSAAAFDLGLDHVTRRLAAVPSDLSWSLADLGPSRELVLRFVRPLPPEEELEEGLGEGLEELEELKELEDVASAASKCASGGELQVELRVAYSAAHEVPVLFCRAWDVRSAKPASLALLWRLFAKETVAGAGSDLLNALGPAEHPPTGLPMFALHPCRTATVMATLRPARPEHFVKAWLSVFGPALGLRLPCAVFKEEEEEVI